MTRQHHHTTQSLWTNLPAGFGEHLDAEARLGAPVRDAALDLAADVLDTEPGLILDLGSGTGTDAVALAQSFQTARVHALDISPELLTRVRSLADESGLAGRITDHRVDLDGEWPAAVGADLVWAALSLHHLDHPGRALKQAFSALRPGGAIVLTELVGNDELTLGDLGSTQPALQNRITETVNAAAHRSQDWGALLADAGFASVEHHAYELAVHTHTREGAQYLEHRLQGLGERLAGTLSEQDRAALDAAIGDVRTGTSVGSFSSGRDVWVAKRPDNAQAGRSPGTDAEVAIVGGGAAGLAAATVLARSRRTVAVIDDGHPRNAPAEGAHNVLGNEGIAPLELLATGRAEAAGYGAEFIQRRVVRISGDIDDFTLELDGAGPVRARRIILATGLVDDLPDIPGVKAGWGRSVLHCPFCHGWEVRDKQIAILARGDSAVHQAMLFRQLSNWVTVFLSGGFDPTEEQREQLAALGVPVVESGVERLAMDGAQVRGVVTENGQTFRAEAAVVAPRFNSRTDLYESLGGSAQETPFGTQIPTDPRGLTPLPGAWAVGNAAQPMAMVAGSAASGVTTGSAVHGDLAMADLDRAVLARRTSGV